MEPPERGGQFRQPLSHSRCNAEVAKLLLEATERGGSQSARLVATLKADLAAQIDAKESLSGLTEPTFVRSSTEDVPQMYRKDKTVLRSYLP